MVFKELKYTIKGRIHYAKFIYFIAIGNIRKYRNDWLDNFPIRIYSEMSVVKFNSLNLIHLVMIAHTRVPRFKKGFGNCHESVLYICMYIGLETYTYELRLYIELNSTTHNLF